MRGARHAGDLDHAVAVANSEAQAAFDDPRVY
jgi:biotin carboxylase